MKELKIKIELACISSYLLRKLQLGRQERNLLMKQLLNRNKLIDYYETRFKSLNEYIAKLTEQNASARIKRRNRNWRELNARGKKFFCTNNEDHFISRN